ncbi:hypothetical protein PG990_000999 [Apiospora arundinis]
MNDSVEVNGQTVFDFINVIYIHMARSTASLMRAANFVKWVVRLSARKVRYDGFVPISAL